MQVKVVAAELLEELVLVVGVEEDVAVLGVGEDVEAVAQQLPQTSTCDSFAQLHAILNCSIKGLHIRSSDL